jgi:aralkylamine N-acetyltransferase
MTDAGTVRFQRDSRGIDWQELVRLFQLANMGGRGGDKVRRGFENSTVVCFALDSHRLVGAARALSDGEYHATVYDVVVHPEYQRRGIGSRLMNELLAALPVWRVLLVVEEDARPFYQRLGFARLDNVLARFDPRRLYDTV